MANRTCNLECIKKGKKGDGEALEFVGPVKIVLVDRSDAPDYKRVIWYAAAIGVAEMMLATVTIIAQFFAMGHKKTMFLKGLHVLSGTIGLQACLLSGILVLNPHSGPAAPVSVEGRKVEHVCVQFCGLLFSVIGVASAYLTGFKSFMSLHSILGFAATGFAILAGISGLFLYKFSGYSSSMDKFGLSLYFHIIFAIVACITSSMCFVSGMTSNVFRKWLPVTEMYHYMILCCAVYTTIIVYKPLIMLITGSRDGFTNY